MAHPDILPDSIVPAVTAAGDCLSRAEQMARLGRSDLAGWFRQLAAELLQAGRPDVHEDYQLLKDDKL